MPKIQLIGKASGLKGKKVFEILANLKNFGVGRMIARNSFDKYPEPSYYIIHKVEPVMDEELTFGTIWVEEVFRGKRTPGIKPIIKCYHPDFRLIPKEEEKHHLKGYQIVDLGTTSPTILPRYLSVPPLMREFLIRCKREKGQHVDQDDDFKIPFDYKQIDNFHLKYKIADKGEEPYAISSEIKLNPRFLKGVQEI